MMTLVHRLLGLGLLLSTARRTAVAFQPPRDGARARIHLNYNVDDDGGGYEIRDGGNSGGEAPSTTFGADNVPVDQRPSNEYLNLIGAPGFGWASQERGDGGLLVRLAAVYVALFAAVGYPIAGATWVDEGFVLQKAAAANVGALSVIFVLVLRLYSGWGYIGARLRDKNIEYEESGWYDGAQEQKSEAEKARDLFLYRSDVRPVEARLKKFALATGGAWLASCVALNAAVQTKPIFDQYDAKLLNAERYDDKVAEVVRTQSNGRPTYCDSRYYRAVANGGQGEIATKEHERGPSFVFASLR